MSATCASASEQLRIESTFRVVVTARAFAPLCFNIILCIIPGCARARPRRHQLHILMQLMRPSNVGAIMSAVLKGISNDSGAERTSLYDTQNIRIIGIPDTCRADRRRHNAGERAKCTSAELRLSISRHFIYRLNARRSRRRTRQIERVTRRVDKKYTRRKV